MEAFLDNKEVSKNNNATILTLFRGISGDCFHFLEGDCQQSNLSREYCTLTSLSTRESEDKNYDVGISRMPLPFSSSSSDSTTSTGSF